MAPMEEMQQAQINRSIRTIKAELEYLCDASVISPQNLSDLLERIPPQTALHAPISVGAVPTANPSVGAPQPPTSPVANLHLNQTRTNSSINEAFHEKRADSNGGGGAYFDNPPAYNNSPAQPPPQAAWAPTAPPLAQATALYAYTSTDAGDLELQPNDHVTVTEYMNAEWWKGRSTRTGMEGIFPRSYVRVLEDKEPGRDAAAVGGSSAMGNNYGNAPLEVSQMGNGEGKVPSKAQEQGKKFGKKLGNAAIFGAGATIGGNIVNSIF